LGAFFGHAGRLALGECGAGNSIGAPCRCLSRWRVCTGAAIDGTATFDDSVIGGPLEASDYRLMQDDAYLVLATTPFSVSASP
jgi:hypothetical protein